MVRRLFILVAAVAAVLGGSVPAGAHDHRPPVAQLRFGSLLQEGPLVRYHWSSVTDEGGCISSLTIGSSPHPRPGLPVGPGRFHAALRLSHPDRPVDLRVVAREAGEEGQRGTSQAVGYSLRPRRAGGQIIGWAAVLRSRVQEHLYLRVTGSWFDRQGCLGPQRATWLFHVSAS